MKELEFSDTSIYDEIYGYIPVTKIELGLINTILFQRLNNIKQLGTAYRVFPGAQHTRFSHSLGVMRLMDRMISSHALSERISEVDTNARQKLRIAALLHDIGHYPLSHAIEVVMTENAAKKERKHEELGSYIVRNSSIANILDKEGVAPAEIAKIITGDHPEPLFNQLMSSELDADRMDYLTRDSIHTGVAYGRFDLNRLIHTLCTDENGLLCVEKSGMHAAEGYIIGRYLMWAVVYTHRVINAFDELVGRIYQKRLGCPFPAYDQIEKMIRKEETEFARFDDHYLLELIHRCDAEDKFVNDLCRMFLKREVLSVAKQTSELTADGKISKENFILDGYKKADKIEKLSRASKVPREWIFHNSSRTKLPELKPSLKGAIQEEEETLQAHKEMSDLLRIAKEIGGRSSPLVNNRNSVVYHLKNMSLDKVRIFTKEDYQKSLRDALNKELKKALT